MLCNKSNVAVVSNHGNEQETRKILLELGCKRLIALSPHAQSSPRVQSPQLTAAEKTKCTCLSSVVFSRTFRCSLVLLLFCADVASVSHYLCQIVCSFK